MKCETTNSIAEDELILSLLGFVGKSKEPYNSTRASIRTFVAASISVECY